MKMTRCLRIVAVLVAAGVLAGCSAPAGPTPSSAGGAAISGVVSGATGDGLTATVAGTSLSAAVDAAGRFDLSGVGAGNVQLQFRNGSTSASASLANVTNDQFIELQVQISGTNAAIVSELRTAKVVLCHREGTGSYHSINVSVNAEGAHRAHGDGEIGDPVPATPTMRFGPDCRPIGPGIELVKSTNGFDANDAPGPRILVGQPITWTYRVTNIGTAQLTGLVVTDDEVATVVCPSGPLAPGASVTCSASGVAELGPYRNVGTATASWALPTFDPPSGTVTDTDPSHYLGVLTLDDDEEGPKVSLCHRTGNGSFHMINVSVNAEPAHMGHGDGRPNGPVPGQSGKTFSATCGIQ
jgi:hypothetical protein